MNFEELKGLAGEFRVLLSEASGRELIAEVTVDEPTGQKDELHFLKLVSWSYVLLFEASQPAARYIVSLLRAADPSEHKTVSAVFEAVNHLRTVRVHNLIESKSDDYKRRQAGIWLLQNGGDPPDWVRCCDSLCAQVASALRVLLEKWRRVLANSDDAAAAVGDLLLTIDREWPPHFFDRIVEVAAKKIELRGLDYVKYRQHKLERWRELVSFFEDRQHAEAALELAIFRELESLFGAK